MRALPFILALAAALLVAGPALAALRKEGFLRENYRRRRLPFPAGFIIVAAALLALIPLGALYELAGADVLPPDLGRVALYAIGVALLGLVDDVLSRAPRGWRGHGTAVLGGEFSTGALKAAGSLGLAMLALAGRGQGAARYLLEVAVLVLATNTFNLLDLRPGRAIKALVALGAALTVGAWSARALAAVGLFLGPALVVGWHDLRERAMMGDTGANLLGALAGLWLVLSLGVAAQVVALLALAGITAYGEFRSISALIERTPVLRDIDSLGRPA